ncbi:hypothetical protein DID77_00515 [Candidatus Marinamargulisbacteria bacterium SCGC AG-439-L15]|nr:hypothetical protein DID77_00515 [Candidatus Marinamargulisbacteria bacterium SCGC AG-439-L15]
MPAIPPISPQSSSTSPQGTSLSKETAAFLKTHFNMNKVTIVKVEPGTKTLEGFKVIDQLETLNNSELLQDLATLADPSTNIDSAIVLIGGQDIVKEKLKELEGNLKKVNKKKTKKLLEALGLCTENEDVYFSNGGETLPGGLLIVQSSLKELEKAVDED